MLGGAVFLVCKSDLLQGIQFPVPGQQKRSAIADFQVLRGDGDAFGHHILHLQPKVFGIQRHAVAENVGDAFPENTGGEQVKGELAVGIDDGMARVAAALIAYDNVIVLRQQIHHPALAFVTPVDAYNRGV